MKLFPLKSIGKQGKGESSKFLKGLGVFLIFAMFMIVGGTGVWFMTSQSGIRGTTTTITTPEGKQVTAGEDLIAQSKIGKYSQGSYLVYDWMQTDKSSADAIPTTIYSKSSGTYLSDANAVVSSTSTNSFKTKIGEELSVYAFNTSASGGDGGYYAVTNPYDVVSNGHTVTFDPTNFKILDEQPLLEVHTLKIANQMDVQMFDSTLKSGKNLSISAGSSNSYEYLRIKNNDTNAVYALAGFYVDTPTNTNVTSIDVGAGITLSTGKSATLERTNIKIGRKQETANYVFEFDSDSAKAGKQAILLEPGDQVKTAPYKVTVDSDGCIAQEVSEPLDQIFIFDKACYRSTLGTKIICDAIETDASSPTDVGGVDFALFYATSDSPGNMYCTP